MAGLIPQAFINDLLHKTDIVELIDSYLPLKKRGNSHLACCPFHNEKSPSFNVIAKKQFYHCFGCGESGNAISFVMHYNNQGFVDAVETLATRAGLTIPREGDAAKHQQIKNLFQLLNQVSQYYQKNLKEKAPDAVQYLKNRGLDGKTAALYQLGYAANGWNNLESQFKNQQEDLITTGMLIKNEEGKIYDRYRHRITFPIHDRQGRIIGFGGRALEAEQKPKYLNSPETILFQKNRELYGLHQVLQQKTEIHCILIVEGYMDVIALAQHGITQVVATLGTATSSYHIQLLAKYTKSIIFCFDGDNAGDQAAWRALESSLPHLNTGLDAGFIFIPEGHDPDSLVREEGKAAFLNRVKNPIPLHQYFLQKLSQGINLQTPAGKTQFVNSAKPYMAKISESPFKEILIESIARLTHIENHRLSSLLDEEKETVIFQPKSTGVTRTPLRIVIALLLQHPEMYNKFKLDITLTFLEEEEFAILKRCLEYLEQFEHPTTANLVEAWRDTPHFNAINKLAYWDHQVPEAQLQSEFKDTLLFLEKQNQDKKINQLIEKSRHITLSDNERMMLQNMLKARATHQLLAKTEK